jgi:hypothetical protein
MSEETKIKADRRELFNHIKEACIADPFYVTKILLGAVGKNFFDIVIRMAIYVLILYPFLLKVVGLSQGVAFVLVIGGIIIYHSAIAIYHRIADDATKRVNGVK